MFCRQPRTMPSIPLVHPVQLYPRHNHDFDWRNKPPPYLPGGPTPPYGEARSWIDPNRFMPWNLIPIPAPPLFPPPYSCLRHHEGTPPATKPWVSGSSNPRVEIRVKASSLACHAVGSSATLPMASSPTMQSGATPNRSEVRLQTCMHVMIDWFNRFRQGLPLGPDCYNWFAIQTRGIDYGEDALARYDELGEYPEEYWVFRVYGDNTVLVELNGKVIMFASAECAFLFFPFLTNKTISNPFIFEW